MYMCVWISDYTQKLTFNYFRDKAAKLVKHEESRRLVAHTSWLCVACYSCSTRPTNSMNVWTAGSRCFSNLSVDLHHLKRCLTWVAGPGPQVCLRDLESVENQVMLMLWVQDTHLEMSGPSPFALSKPAAPMRHQGRRWLFSIIMDSQDQRVAP